MENYKILNSKPNVKKIMTISEFCQEYSLGRNKAYNLCHRFDAPVLFNGRKILLIRSQVDSWIESLKGKQI
ncbi:DNA-binding protein [Clostridium sp. WILCCON 0269]|uniref:DNA-binding protein n=1 Tax=Candidatus Clostridium eludens TaxID=3381663 RepID=A0ABW8SQZ9_9CLOT